ncbi:FAD-dependent monooxygenase [Streptomyces sp. b94]|uniref:FAD-dependent oxidoreductase n=1 Tax=Streptomyces sp. b94 TaxID=1827634 RepID=UPI001B3989D8|nr:NAD(P)/FAD-dependent oxidoreductase [Streptomyces sp. b94]MBQ1101109.1 FAD-dependent monooxygenase [Streptomyces sp. b94]
MSGVENVDAVVVGAGPGGCAAALGLARGGAQVLVLERYPDRRSRFAGEWLHPAGVAALARLGIAVRPPHFLRHHGFVVHPGGGQPPIKLPYAWGEAATAPHQALVRPLQEALNEQPGVRYTPGRRFCGLTAGGCLTDAGPVTARLVVGADGRSSGVRRALRQNSIPAVALSHTAGMLLPDTPLPDEGFGHVFLGGPGPVLAYRLTKDLVRLTMDVPLSRPGPQRMRGYLERSFTPHLPRELAEALRSGLGDGGVQWAANSFRRRADFGHGRVALVGDAAGHGHPLAAQGLSCALLDAESLAAHVPGSVDRYHRERVAHSWAAERVAAALHRALTGPDQATAVLRRSLFALWRADPGERARTMDLLGLLEGRRTVLGGSVANIAVGALVDTLRDGQRDPIGSAMTIGGLVGWLGWLSGPRVGVPPRQHGRGVALLAP